MLSRLPKRWSQVVLRLMISRTSDSNYLYSLTFLGWRVGVLLVVDIYKTPFHCKNLKAQEKPNGNTIKLKMFGLQIDARLLLSDTWLHLITDVSDSYKNIMFSQDI